ncbi:hypothetical protein EYF80_020155 [Liparis tanakae]|uniref:Uncharacterized protein n=1 Tax=Liparis tanakae TaxID=230148 RepID=A0A4Z2HWF8_9TELE|nr:hypothetical protein EYF80_020155 [Liparis tanakae]
MNEKRGREDSHLCSQVLAVGQHLLQGSDGETLGHDEGADRQVWGHILVGMKGSRAWLKPAESAAKALCCQAEFHMLLLGGLCYQSNTRPDAGALRGIHTAKGLFKELEFVIALSSVGHRETQTGHIGPTRGTLLALRGTEEDWSSRGRKGTGEEY